MLSTRKKTLAATLMLVALLCFGSAALAQDNPDTMIDDWLLPLVDLFTAEEDGIAPAPSDFDLGANLGGGLLDLNTRGADSLPPTGGERWWREFSDILAGPRV